MSKNMNLIMENWRRFSNDTVVVHTTVSNINFLCSELEKLQQNKSLLENKKLLLQEQRLLKEVFENIKSLFSSVFSSGKPKTDDVSALANSLKAAKKVTRSPIQKAILDKLSLLAIVATLFTASTAKADYSPADLVDLEAKAVEIIKDPKQLILLKKAIRAYDPGSPMDPQIKSQLDALYKQIQADVSRTMDTASPDLSGPMGVDLLDAANAATTAVKQASAAAAQASTTAYTTVGDISRNIFNTKEMFEDTIKKLNINLQQIQTAQGVVNTILNKLVVDGLISIEQRDNYASGAVVSKWVAAAKQYTKKP